MKAGQAEVGKLYKVKAAKEWQYLTVNEVYKCDSKSKTCIGLHRPTNGAGTYVMGRDLNTVEIEEV